MSSSLFVFSVVLTTLVVLIVWTGLPDFFCLFAFLCLYLTVLPEVGRKEFGYVRSYMPLLHLGLTSDSL